MVDYYQILEVPRTASAREIKAAYKRLAMKFHPDHNLNNPFAEDYFKRVNEAYRVLGDMNKKYLYDLGMAIPSPAQTSTQQAQAYAYTTEQYEPYVNSYDPKNFVSASMKRKIGIGAIVFCLLMAVVGIWFNAYMNNRSARFYMNEAKVLYKGGESQQALLKITHALDYDAYFFEAYLLRAKIHTERFNFFRAIEDYDYVLKHKKIENPQEAGEIHFQRGYSYYRAYDFENALKDFDVALARRENEPKYRFFKVATLIKNNKATPELCAEVAKAHHAGIKEADEFVRIYCTPPKTPKIENSEK